MGTNAAFVETPYKVATRRTTSIPTLPSDQSESLFDLEQISQLGLEGYRIALIAPEDRSHRCSENLAEPCAPPQFLVLPLTWEQFCMQTYRLRSEADCPRDNCAQFGEVHIDFDSMQVRRSGRVVMLTAMEFKVLKFFVLNPGRVVSRDSLLNQVWGYNAYPCTRTVDNHIMKLRQKLEPNVTEPFHFRTVHGVGYKFIPQ